MILNDAQKIYIGDNEVNKVYLQDTLIYTSAPPATPFYVFRLAANITTGTTFLLPLLSAELYNFRVSWGDGIITNVVDLSGVSKFLHDYGGQGVAIIDITATKPNGFPGLRYGGYGFVDQDIIDAQNSLFFVDLKTDCPFITMEDSFKGCVSLDTFIAQNFLSATNFDGAWQDCTILPIFPAISCPQGNSFINTWRNCTSMYEFNFYTDTFAKMLSGNGCFQGIALASTTWSNLLTSISATNTNLGVVFGGGSSQRNTVGTSAYNYLQNQRNWIITDGGQVPGPPPPPPPPGGSTTYVSYE